MGAREKALEQYLREHLPLYDYMDLKIECASGGEYRCSVPLHERNSNHFGTVHAALQWAAAEVLGGLVYFSAIENDDRFLAVVKSFSIEFRKPAFTNLVVETHFSDAQLAGIKSALEEHGRYNFELDAVVKNSAGETVAESHGVYAIRSRTD